MKKNGFTLVEVLIAVILVGLAIVSLVAANNSFTQANAAGTDLSTAEFLVEQAKELTALTTFDNLWAFDDQVYSPPKAADGTSLNDFSQFSQHVTVQSVNPSNFDQVVGDHSTSFVKVTVNVFLNSQEICSDSWIRAKY